MSTPTDAQTAEIAEKKGSPFGSITFLGVDYEIARKPNPLLLSELGRIGSGDPEAMGAIAEFFENVLADYRAFKKAVYTADEPVDETQLMGVLQEVMEKTMGRPTE